MGSGGGIARHVVEDLTPFEQNLILAGFVFLAAAMFIGTYFWMSRKMR